MKTYFTLLLPQCANIATTYFRNKSISQSVNQSIAMSCISSIPRFCRYTDSAAKLITEN